MRILRNDRNDRNKATTRRRGIVAAWTRSARWATCALALGGLLTVGACDEDPVDTPDVVTPPANLVNKQERLEISEFNAVADGDLATIAGGLSLVSAGVVEDTDGNVVTWAEADDGQAAVRFCDSSAACTDVKQTIEAGALKWVDASGASVTPKTMGKPKLLKNLQGNDLDGKTLLAQQLDADALPSVELDKRDFHLLNTFGPALDVDLSKVEAAVKRHGGFDRVVETPYVREGLILDLFEDLDAMDAVVWLSQGVRQEVKTGVEFKTIGLTVNRAGFGEDTMSFQALDVAASKNVTSGPGLVVLAASNSYSDGSAGQPSSGSIWETLDDGERVLVGIQGDADVNRVMAAVTTFVDLYLTGDVGLADAIDTANEAFKGTGALLRTNGDGLRTYPKSYDAVWDKAGYTPTSARITTFIAATPSCDGEFQANNFATAWADVTFDGAFFSGNRQSKVDNTYTTDTNVRGLIVDLEVGGRILVEWWGGLDKAIYQDTYGFGEGTIVGIDTLDNGDIEVTFNGDAHTAPYKDDQGRTCVLNTPKLTTTVSAPSKLLLTP